METPHIPGDKYRKHAKHVPLIEIVTDDTLLTEKDALAIVHDLSEVGSQIPARTLKLVENVKNEVLPHLEQIPDTDKYIVSTREMHGILAKMGIIASAQTVRDIGENMEIAHDLHEKLLPPLPEIDPS